MAVGPAGTTAMARGSGGPSVVGPRRL